MPKESRAFLGAIALCIFAILWSLFGAPLKIEEWQGIPSQFQMSFRLLPSRAVHILSLFHLERTAGVYSDQNQVKLFDNEANQLVSLPMEEYLIGVLAQEMPASYHLEALKAQAVAARTRLTMGCDKHTDAMACTDPAHCQGYLTEDKQKEKWGAEFNQYYARLKKAVEETKDEIITYEGKPITVLFHAVSGGFTEDAKAVFGEDVPYLKSVQSSGEEGVNKFETKQSFSNAEAVSVLNAAFPNAHLTQELLPIQMVPLSHTDSGRVESLQLGDTIVTGRELREALNLNSTLFSLQFTDSTLTFLEKGYGHGVGMSQAGANAMAAKGSDYKTILTHYYGGTQIVSWNETASLGEANNEVSHLEDAIDGLEGQTAKGT